MTSAPIAFLVMSVFACSGTSTGGPQSPTGPGPVPTSITIRVLSAVNGSPVPAATVTLAGKQAQSDANGSVTLSYENAPTATRLDILATGYLIFTGRFSGSGMTVELLPKGGEYSEAFMREVVYMGVSQMRFPLGAVCFVPSEEMRRSDLLASIEAQAAEVARATLQPVSVTTNPSGCVSVAVRFDPSLNIAGITSTATADGRVTSGVIRIRSEIWVLRTNVVTHEMGHIMGLGHIPVDETPGIMSTIGGDIGFLMTFTPREVQAFAFQRKRAPGNFWEDRAFGS